MGKTIKELCSSISLSELMQWAVYYGVEPWGSRVEGVRMATNTAAVYNAGLMASDPKKLRSKPFKPEQFYVGVDKESKAPEQTWQEQRSILKARFGIGGS